MEAFIAEVEGQLTNLSTPRCPKTKPRKSDSDLEQQYLNLLGSTSTSDSSVVGNPRRKKDPNFEPISSQLSTSEFETPEEETNESSSDFGLDNMGGRTGVSSIPQDEMEMYQREITRMGSSAISRSADSGISLSASRRSDDAYVEDDWLIDDLADAEEVCKDSTLTNDDAEDDAYVEDDWLVDDLGEANNPKPRKRSLAEAFFECNGRGGTPIGKTSQKKPKTSASQPKQTKLLPVNRKSSQEKKTMRDERRSGDNAKENEGFRSNFVSKETTQNNKSSHFGFKQVGSKQPKITTFRADSPVLDSRPSSPTVRQKEFYCKAPTPSKKLITVKICEHAFLVPLPDVTDGLSVSWLCDEAANRYSKKFGSRPNLTVCLQSGAMVDKDDPLDIFEGQTEVLCNVDSWHVVGIEETYTNCCCSEGVKPIEEILSKLRLSDAEKTLDFHDVVFETPMAVRATLKTLSGHSKLQRLSLEETILNGNDWSLVINALGSLKCLKDLSLSASGLKKANLEKMSKRLTQLCGEESSIVKSLRKLDLSFNTLRDEAVGSISALLSVFSNLFSLNLDCVGLVNPPAQLAASLRSSTAKELNLSRNQLADCVLSCLVASLEGFTDLKLAGIFQNQQIIDGGFSEGLLKLTTNANSRLQTLDISSNNIPRHFVYDVVAALSQAKHLHSLSLAHVGCVTDDVMIHFLKKIPKSLKRLDIEGISLSKPMKLELIDAITDWFQGVVDSFGFSKVDQIDADTLVAQWNDIKGDISVVKGPVGSRRKYLFCLTTL